eukprot:898679-Lingulodinium_polyedra.AAC.1
MRPRSSCLGMRRDSSSRYLRAQSRASSSTGSARGRERRAPTALLCFLPRAWSRNCPGLGSQQPHAGHHT